MSFPQKSNLKRFENCEITVHQVDMKFYNNLFIFVAAKKIQFVNCDFSFCKFNDAYFRSCKFINCKFTGAKFVDSNLTRSKFENCSFDYCEFRNTHISFNDISKNWPQESSIRRRLAQNLRKNYEGMGEREAARKSLIAEIDAQKAFLKEAFKGENYHKEFYPSKIRALIDLGKIYVGWYLWGYGEHPARFLLSILVLIVLICLAALIPAKIIALGPLAFKIVETSLDAIYGFLGLKSEFADSILGDGAKVVLALARLLAISLFTSSLIKRFGWR